MNILDTTTLTTSTGDNIFYVALAGIVLMIIGILFINENSGDTHPLFIIGMLISLLAVCFYAVGSYIGVETHVEGYEAYVDDMDEVEEKGYRIIEHKEDDIYIVEKVGKESSK